MTKQPNERAAALRMVLDLLDELDADLRVREVSEPDASESMKGFCEGLQFARLALGSQIVDGLQDQLLDAGGFLGDEPEPEERAFILDRNGQVMASYDVDELDPDIYAEQFAAASGFDISDDDGRIPDGCEDFSVRIAQAPDAVRCWTSRNYMMKGE